MSSRTSRTRKQYLFYPFCGPFPYFPSFFFVSLQEVSSCTGKGKRYSGQKRALTKTRTQWGPVVFCSQCEPLRECAQNVTPRRRLSWQDPGSRVLLRQLGNLPTPRETCGFQSQLWRLTWGLSPRPQPAAPTCRPRSCTKGPCATRGWWTTVAFALRHRA